MYPHNCTNKQFINSLLFYALIKAWTSDENESTSDNYYIADLMRVVLLIAREFE